MRCSLLFTSVKAASKTHSRPSKKAYDEVTKYKLAPQFHNQVLKIGKGIADGSEDSAAQRTWSQRSTIQ